MSVRIPVNIPVYIFLQIPKTVFHIFCLSCILACKTMKGFVTEIHAFFIRNTLSNPTLKFVKNQATAKQHPEAELLLFENCSLSSSSLPSQKKGDILKNVQKDKFVVCFNEVI